MFSPGYFRMVLAEQFSGAHHFLTAAIQNIKRMVASSFSVLLVFKARFSLLKRALSVI